MSEFTIAHKQGDAVPWLYDHKTQAWIKRLDTIDDCVSALGHIFTWHQVEINFLKRRIANLTNRPNINGNPACACPAPELRAGRAGRFKMSQARLFKCLALEPGHVVLSVEPTADGQSLELVVSGPQMPPVKDYERAKRVRITILDIHDGASSTRKASSVDVLESDA